MVFGIQVYLCSEENIISEGAFVLGTLNRLLMATLIR